MPALRRAALSATILGLAMTPVAEARQPVDRTVRSHVRAKLRMTSMTGVPSSIVAGRAFRVRGRVANLPHRMTETGRLTFTLRKRVRSGRKVYLRGADLFRTQASTTRRFSLRIRVPRRVAAGRWVFRACVRRGSGERSASCKWKRIRVTKRSSKHAAGGGGTGAPAPAPGGPAAPGLPDGLHSLRSAVTDQNFYFVMADRFDNGDSANDNGGLPRGTDNGHSEGESGFDPTGKGWFHGGDLAGLRKRLGYIQDLGTTAIWLTPSFKNKAVQDNNGFPSAGYHGYWVTDFTQIDPHFGTNGDLRALIRDAHARGIKVYFDIIANPTADVIRYREGASPAYRSKDEYPYRTAAGTPFDDRDYADGSKPFPALLPSGTPPCPDGAPGESFAYHPCVPAAEATEKVPAWLNDVSAYHNRGNTTFTGENSTYGDFFGLDDLFTEQPRVVNGMIDIYKTWIRDFRIDGFRMDTMKHVNDEFWQKFAPAITNYAHAQGIPDFYMFGEVAEDTSRPITSHFMTHDDVQGVLDFPFQTAATRFAANSAPTDELRNFFRDDDWYTDADSNVYQLPTFLGNHDKGRIGMFLRNANPGASENELLARDELAHELMYFSRGNPVVYYGDEQGFTGAGGDQDARQDMFPSQDVQYNNRDDAVSGDDGAGRNDDIGSDATPMDDNFDRSQPLYRLISRLADLTREHPALRNGAQQDRYATGAAGIYAFSRLDRRQQREYVVALNNSEQEQTATIPTWMPSGGFTRIYGAGARQVASDSAKRLRVAVPALSAVVYRADGRIPRSDAAPPVSIAAPPAGGSGRDRLEVRADVGGDSFYEVTFLAKVGGGAWHEIGTDDNAPYRVFHDVAGVAPGTPVQYRAVVLDDARHQRASAIRSATVAPPALTLEAPPDNGRARGRIEVRATATPELANYVVTFQRRVGGGAFEDIGTDDSSPVYTAFDDTAGLPDGATLTYRAILTYAPGRTVVSGTRSVTVVNTPVTTATVHYFRPAGDYADWGLHLWGDAIAPAAATTWGSPRQRDGVDADGAFFNIPIQDDTKPVNFIVHRPGGDSVPTTREPGGDRSFVPLDHPQIWLRQGDPTIYYSKPPPP